MQNLFFTSILILLLHQTTTENSEKSCYDLATSDHPELIDRFGYSLVSRLCAKGRDWIDEAEATNANNVQLGAGQQQQEKKLPLAPDQLAYFESAQYQPTQGAPGEQTPLGNVTRKEIRSMTDDERKRWFNALNTLKSETIGDMTKYNILVVHHTPEYSPEAHFGAAFLPFHRQFLYNIETKMREIDPDLAVPYWDTTLDAYLPDPIDSILWTEEFMGNGDGEVVIGPFYNWTILKDVNLTQDVATLSPCRKIVRDLGKNENGSLFTNHDIDYLLNQSKFENLTYCINPYFELVHGAVHDWIGGHMSNLRTAVNDPCFFLVHGWIDFMWEQWRRNRQTPREREADYGGYEKQLTGFEEPCNKFAYPNMPLKPYKGVVVKDGLSNVYTDWLYSYEPRPTCPSCNGSPYLYCDANNARCMSKIKLNGNCTGYDGEDICHKGQCIGGICTVSTSYK